MIFFMHRCWKIFLMIFQRTDHNSSKVTYYFLLLLVPCKNICSGCFVVCWCEIVIWSKMLWNLLWYLFIRCFFVLIAEKRLSLSMMLWKLWVARVWGRQDYPLMYLCVFTCLLNCVIAGICNCFQTFWILRDLFEHFWSALLFLNIQLCHFNVNLWFSCSWEFFNLT